MCFGAGEALALDGTWLAAPGSGDFDTGANWSSNPTVPDGIATFGASAKTSLIFSTTPTTINTFRFTPGAPLYIFNVTKTVTLNGGGIVNNSSNSPVFAVSSSGKLHFDNASAGNATINNTNELQFLHASTAGSATISNSGSGKVDFLSTSLGGNATITNSALATFQGNATPGQARLITNGVGVTDFSGTSGPAGDHKISAGSIEGSGTYALGSNQLTVGSNNVSTEVSGIIKDGGLFGGVGGCLVKTGAATLTLSGTNTYTGCTTVNGGALSIQADANLGSGGTLSLLDGTTLVMTNSFTLIHPVTVAGEPIIDVGAGLIDTISSVIANGTAPGAIVKSGAGTLVLAGPNTYSGGTFFNGGTVSAAGDSNLGASTGALTFDGGTLQLTNPGALTLSPTRAVTLNAGGGEFDVENGDVTINQGIGGPGALTKSGPGELILGGTNSYGGATLINKGTLLANGGDAIPDLSGVVISNGAVLSLGKSETIGSLEGGGLVTTPSSEPVTLTTGGNNASTTFAGTIVDGGSTTIGLNKVGTGTFTLSGANSYTGATTVAGGTLELNGSVVSPTTVDNGARLQGSGTFGGVTVLSGGIYSAGNSVGTQTVNGPFKLAAGGIYEVGVDAAGHGDKMVVNGTVDLTGAILHVLAQNGTYKPSTSYTIIVNNGPDPVKGTFASITSSLAFLAPTVVYNGGDGNDVVLTLTRSVTSNGQVSFASVAHTRNQRQVALALDQFPDSSPLFLAVLNQTVAGAREASDAMSGEVHASLGGVLVDDSRYVREAILGRLTQASYAGGGTQMPALGGNYSMNVPSLKDQTMAFGPRGNIYAAPPPPAGPDLVFWTRGFGAWGNFEGNGNAASASRQLGGFVSGLDAGVGGGWRLGAATGFSQSDINVDARHSSADVNTVYLAGFAGGNLGPFAVRSGGVWGWHDIDTSRAVVFPGFYENEKASYGGDTGQIFGEAAFPVLMGAIATEPFVGLGFVHVSTDAFKERGGVAALKGAAEDENVGYSTLGLRLASTMQMQDMLITPHVSVAWQHAFDDVTPVSGLAFLSTGTGFAAQGVPLAQSSALVDVGLDLNLSPNVTVGLSYSGQFSSDLQDNAVKGRFTWLF